MELDGTTSSIRPDPGFSCVFFKYVSHSPRFTRKASADRPRNAVCRDFNDGKDSITFKNPGSDNLLVTDEGDWNDQILGFQCFKSD